MSRGSKNQGFCSKPGFFRNTSSRQFGEALATRKVSGFEATRLRKRNLTLSIFSYLGKTKRAQLATDFNHLRFGGENPAELSKRWILP